MSAIETCPFCGESGFDLIGLKGHLLEWCEVFEATETPHEQARRWRREKIVGFKADGEPIR